MRRVLIPLAVNPVAPSSGAAAQGIETLRGETMGTSWSAHFLPPPGGAPGGLRAAIEREFAIIIDEMSTWVPSSCISRFNAAPARARTALPERFAEVLSCALALAEETGGAFDPAAGALAELWGFGPCAPRTAPPAAQEIEAARARSGWRRLGFSRAEKTIRQPGGLRLDLSGIAKGYAVDRLCAVLRGAGIQHYLAEIGGELSGAGVKPDGTPWWVTLDRPPEAAAASEFIVALHGLSVATSGDYVRYFESGGTRYAHMIDPRTGYPAAGGIAAVTVFQVSCMRADALATALGVLGLEAGMAHARAHNIPALFLMRGADGLSEHMSPAFKAMLE